MGPFPSVAREFGFRPQAAPWQCLYFLPDLHQHGSFRPSFGFELAEG